MKLGVHNALHDWLAQSVLYFEALARLREDTEAEFAGNQGSVLRDQQRVNKSIEVTKRKISRLVAALEEGDVMSKLRDRLQQRRREQEELEIRLADISARLAFGRARISGSAQSAECDIVIVLKGIRTKTHVRDGGSTSTHDRCGN